MLGLVLVTASMEVEGNWVIGAENQNCNDACAALSLECSEQELLEKNPAVDSSDELISLIQSLGGRNFTSCNGRNGMVPSNPSFSATRGTCLFSDSSRDLSTVDCGAKPRPPAQKKQRLCWCHPPAKSVAYAKPGLFKDSDPESGLSKISDSLDDTKIAAGEILKKEKQLAEMVLKQAEIEAAENVLQIAASTATIENAWVGVTVDEAAELPA